MKIGCHRTLGLSSISGVHVLNGQRGSASPLLPSPLLSLWPALLPSSRHGTQVHFVQAVRGFLNSFLLPGCSYIPSLLITARSYAPAIPKVLGDPQSTGSGHPRRSAFLGHYQTWQLKVGAFQPSFKLPWSWQPAVSLQIVDEPEEFARLLLCHHLKETRTHR